MKIFLASAIALASYTAAAQTSQDSSKVALEILRKKVDRLRTEVSAKSDSLKSAIRDLETAESNMLIAKYSGGSSGSFIGAVVKIDSKILKKDDPFSDLVDTVKQGQVVRLLDYKTSSWLVAKGNISGYLSDGSIVENEEIRNFKSAIQKRNHEALVQAELEKIVGARKAAESATADEERSKRQARQEVIDRNRQVIAKYGKSLGQKLVDGYYWIGMSAELARVSLGEPETINKSVGSWGVHEQWVYDGIYLYFEKGKVVSYQNSK